MSIRNRLVAALAVCLVAVGATAAYLVVARDSQQRAAQAAQAPATAAVAAVESVPRIVFRHVAPGQEHGQVALVPLGDPTGRRAITAMSCDRVYASGTRTLCLTPSAVASVFETQVHTRGEPTVVAPLSGTPSRARLSGDGKLVATTSFVAGDSYDVEGFSTRTVIRPTDGAARVELEAFRLLHHGKVIRPADRNYWGVTFAGDGDTFFVTVAFDEQTWLARGSLRSATVTTQRPDAECPSLSPDGRRVAYKKLQGRDPGDWRIAVLDLASGRETVLAEDRSVDDQVEWLDDHRILYAMPRDDGTPGLLGSDVWVVPDDGSGTPQVLIKDASSPAVVR